MAVNDFKITDVSPREQYVASSGQTDFVIPFRFFENEDIVAYLEQNTAPENPSSYTITGAGTNTNGTLSFLVGLPAGTLVTIIRDSTVQRVVNFQNSGDWTAQNVNDQFNRQTTYIQEIKQRALEQAITLPPTSPLLGLNFPAGGPGYEDRVIGFNLTGDDLVAGPTFLQIQNANSDAVAAAASAAAALVSENNAAASEASAADSAFWANNDATAANSAANATQTWRNQTLTYRNETETFRNEALSYRNTASTHATNAGNSATAADTSATNASTSEANALAYRNTAQSAAISAAASAAIAANPYPFQFRLTATAGDPIGATDVTNSSTLYCSPFQGNLMALYTGSAWQVFQINEFSLNLTGTTASRPHDIFVYHNGTTAVMEYLAWTNATARATALALQDGILVKQGDATRRYAGTIYVGGTNQVTNNSLKRLIWNYYNRKQMRLHVPATTSSYASTAWRPYNNNAAATSMFFVIGVSEEEINVSCFGYGANNTIGTSIGVGLALDSVAGANTRTPIYSATHGDGGAICSSIVTFPGLGFHYVALVENTGTTSWTMQSVATGVGWVWG